MKNIFAELKAQYDALSRVEKNIADIILSRPDEFITYSMAQLAEICDVSQGSINNFSKKFNYDGFSSLKLGVASSLSSYEQRPFAVVEKEKGTKAAMAVRITESVAAFRNTLEINDEKSLKGAVDKILAAKKIELHGISYSGIVAKDFCYNLIQLGIPATFIGDTLMGAVSATMLNEQSVVIAVSATGATKEIVDTALLAKQNGAVVLALTANRFSPLAKEADIVLLSAPSGMSISDNVSETRLSQLLLVDTLCSYIRSEIDAMGENQYYKLQEIINSHSIKD